MKLLFDENLSPAVALMLAQQDGVDACHVRDRGMLGWEDPEVFERAFKEDRVVVTSNVEDFLELARHSDLHAGLIVIEISDLTRPTLLDVMRAAIKHIDNQDMINRVLWVELDGSMRFEDIPPA